MKILICLFLIILWQHPPAAITRGSTASKTLSLVFTGDEFADGGDFILKTLKEKNIKGSFFLTGNFYRNSRFKNLITRLKQNGHYLGSHSDKHLLYCDWTKRDSLLVKREEFDIDLNNSYKELEKFGVSKNEAHYFLPPYEWYNDSIVSWTKQQGLQLVNYSEGTRSTADYSYPEMNQRYLPGGEIYKSIVEYEANSKDGLKGFILLVHIGTDPRRKDKFYHKLPQLIDHIKRKGYSFVRIDTLLKQQ